MKVNKPEWDRLKSLSGKVFFILTKHMRCDLNKTTGGFMKFNNGA